MAGAATAAAFSAQHCRHRKKNLHFKRKKEKIMKNLEKVHENQQKRRFWRSYEKTDATIKFYAKNYPIRLIFKSVRFKMAKNMLLNLSNQCIRS